MASQDAYCHRQIEARSSLSDVRRSEIDRDACRREIESGIPDGRPDSFLAFLDGNVGKSDDVEVRHSIADIDLHINPMPFKSVDGDGEYLGEHRFVIELMLPIMEKSEKKNIEKMKKNDAEFCHPDLFVIHWYGYDATEMEATAPLETCRADSVNRHHKGYCVIRDS